MAAAITVGQLSKRFGRTRALEDLNLRIDAGAAVALFGPNGAGKTTFLRICATLLRPTGGSVQLFGIDAVHEGAAIRRRLGFLGHESFLYPDLSPTENLIFYARLFHLRDQVARVDALIQRLDLVGWAHRPVRTLSRGLIQRCSLARALLHEPDLILLDEPFSGLDVHAAAALHDVLAEAHRQGTTIVMSTHSLQRGFDLCSSAVVLVRGQLAWHGSIASVDQDQFVARYHHLTHQPAAARMAP